MLIFLSVIATILILLAGFLLLRSPGRPKPFTGADGNPLPGSISEKVFTAINGVQQGMFIKSMDETNPVLLFLHGGPGMPEYFLTRRYPTGLEEHFTVVWWEQRGSCLSYHPGLPPETMTIEQMVADTLALTNTLRQRFGKDKIYLMGHSGGSFFGLLAAAQAPQLYHAYIGVAQVTYQLRSENLAYAYMLEQCQRNGNTQLLQRLKAAPPGMAVPLPAAYDALRDEAMHSLGIGTTRDMKSVITGVFLPSWLCREYTLAEKVNIWRGKIFSMRTLRNAMFAADLTAQVKMLQLPVYFLHGVHDYTTSCTLAKSYFEELSAPLKGFYTFAQSAHSPMFEEPQKTRQILRMDVLAGANSLADVQ